MQRLLRNDACFVFAIMALHVVCHLLESLFAMLAPPAGWQQMLPATLAEPAFVV